MNMMTAFKKLFGYPLLGLGGLFLLAMVVAPLSEVNSAEMNSAETNSADEVVTDEAIAKQATTIAGGLIVGLPLSAAGGSLVLSARDEQRQLSQTQAAFLAEQERLQNVLYQLIASTNGEVTLVQFAIAANIPAVEASTYMNAQAKVFSANFDVTESGSVVYQFPIS